MIPFRIIERPAFYVIGKKTWIAGQDNAIFGRFWEQCQAEGLFEQFERINDQQAGPQTNSITLGVSRVEQDPARREFFYMIAIEDGEAYHNPPDCPETGLETYLVPASQWAVFECRGRVPDSIVRAEIYAFTQWLPASEFVHAHAPEMEVYYPGSGQDEQYYCEFWLPIQRQGDSPQVGAL